MHFPQGSVTVLKVNLSVVLIFTLRATTTFLVGYYIGKLLQLNFETIHQPKTLLNNHVAVRGASSFTACMIVLAIFCLVCKQTYNARVRNQYWISLGLYKYSLRGLIFYLQLQAVIP
jgi:hypothetical protein